MRVLAIDAGFRTGYGLLGGGIDPLSGSLAIAGSSENLGQALEDFREKVATLIFDHAPHVVVIAAPFISRKATPQALRPLFAMYGEVERVAFVHATPCFEVDEPRARRALLGEFLPGKSKDIKAAIVQACHDRGWPCTDDHAGDALCVAAYALDRLTPELAHAQTPLFQKRQKKKANRNG